MATQSLGINIGLNLKGFEEISKINNNFDSLKKAVKNSGLELKNFSRDLASIKAIENKKIKLGIDRENLKDEFLQVGNLLRGGVFALPVKLAMDFESSMADVKKVVDFGSQEELKSFSNDILKLTRTIPLSAKELAKITASGGQIGIAKEELMEYTTLVAKMGVAFDMNADIAGESLSNLKNALQINMKEVASLGDTINHLSDNSAAKASKIIDTVSRVGGVARIFKLSSDQTAALASSFISLGKPSEVAANSINTLLNKLMTAPEQGEKFQETLKKIGMDSKYLKVAIEKNPQQALNTFLGTLENVKDIEKMGILTNLFGTEYADDMALLVSSLNEYKKAQKLINEEGKKGSLDREFKNRSETTANSLILLKSAFEEIAINIGSVFLPAISAVVKVIGTTLNGFMDLINIVPGLTSVVSFAAASFLLFKPAFFLFKLAKNYIEDTILSIVKFTKYIKIKIALLKSLNIVQSINNKLVVIGTSFKRGYTVVITLLSKAFNFLKVSILQSTIALRLKSTLLFLLTPLTKTYTFTIGLLSKAFAFLKIGALAGVTALKILKFALISTGIGAIVVALGVAASYLIENWDTVKEFFLNFWQGIKEVWNAITGFFAMLINPWIDMFKTFFTALWEGFSYIASFVGDVFSFLFTPIIEAWNNLFGGFFNYIREQFSIVLNSIVETFGFLFAPIIEIWNNLFGTFFNYIGERFSIVSNFIAETFGPLFTPLIEIWNNLFGGFFDYLTEKFKIVGDFIGKISSAIAEFFGFGEEVKEITENIKASNIQIGDTKDLDARQDINYSYNNSLDPINPIKQNLSQPQTIGNTQGTAPINITFAGDFSLFANSNGQFDFESFKAQIVKATKEALSKEQFNKANTSIRG